MRKEQASLMLNRSATLSILSETPKILLLSPVKSFCRNSNDNAPFWTPFCKVDRNASSENRDS